jgi:hypothetical protein
VRNVKCLPQIFVSGVLLAFAMTAHAEVLERENASEDMIKNMLMQGSVKGEITSVSYVQDQGFGFLLDVSFEGYDNHSALSFAAEIEKDNRSVGRVVVAEHELGSASGEIQLALSIENDGSQELIEADTLILTVEKGRTRQKYEYGFNKSFGSGTGSGQTSIDTGTSQDEPVALVEIRPKRLNPEPRTFQFKKPTFAFMAQTNQVAQTAQTAQSGQAASNPPSTGHLIQGAQNSNKCFHKKEPNWNNGNSIHLWDCSAGGDQNKKWIYEPSTGYIKSASNKSKCIHKKLNNWNNGNPIHLWDCNVGPASNKSWTYDAKTKLIKARHKTNMCIHKAKPGWADGNILHLYPCSSGSSENKTWNIPVQPVDLSGLIVTGQLFPLGEKADTDAQGPGAKIDLIEDLDNANFENRDFLGIEVYEDKNPASGVYYYHPLYYSLDWDPSQDDRHKYGMEIVYDSGPDGQHISMGMRLRASYSEKQYRFVWEILDARNPNFSKLNELEGPTAVTMTDNLTNLFGISEDNIVVTPPAQKQVKVAWLTNSIAKESLATALTSQMGLDGRVEITKDGREFGMSMIGHLATNQTYGQIEWDRDNGWENKTFHPLVLKNMHAIKVGTEMSVDSWDLHSTQVPVGAMVKWDASEVPANLNEGYDYVWFEYGVEGCDSCDRKAVQAITGGTGNETKVTVSFNVMTPISSCELAAGVMKIRSRNLRPDSNQLETVDIAINDQMSFEQVFYMLPEQAGQQIAEYQILGVQSSGQMLQTNQFLPINDTVIYIGSHQVAELHGSSVDCQ